LIFTQAADADVAAFTSIGTRVERPSSGHTLTRRLGERSLREQNAELRGVELHAVLARLGELEMNEVLVEAGPTLGGAFVQQGLADELLLYMAPKLLGPQARPLFDLPLLDDLQQAPRFRIIEQIPIGEDLRLRLRKI
jgi:riboflavin biosynthesis pyrimidine reductase